MKKLTIIIAILLFSSIVFAGPWSPFFWPWWVKDSGPSGDGLLLESTGFLLLESGDYLLLE